MRNEYTPHLSGSIGSGSISGHDLFAQGPLMGALFSYKKAPQPCCGAFLAGA
jgi:hypothetical protein